MGRAEKIAKNVVAKGLVARNLVASWDDSDHVRGLINVIEEKEKEFKQWLSYYRSTEAKNYLGRGCETGIENMTKVLKLCADTKRQLEEIYKKDMSFGSWANKFLYNWK